MTREELNEVLADIQPILRAYSDSDTIDPRIEDNCIILTPKMRGFTGHFIEAIAAYLATQLVSWVVISSPETRIEIW